MKHLGDITKIRGDKIEPVDCITFGSPCQDLSIAGRRAGLAGERSGLFMEAVRIIKEMRSSTNGLYPTFAVWENVQGAFSSNGGEDFRAVLEELASVEQPDASIPRPPRGGRWSKAGAIAGNGWSLAWRQLDAQYWGVPQRRKRIALVADFGGQRAAEILFERTSLSGNPESCVKAWKEVAGLAANGTAGNDRVVGQNAYTIKIRGGCAGGGKGALVQTEKVGTLSTLQDQTVFQPIRVTEAIPINTQIATRYISMGERTGIGIGEDGDPAYTLQANHEHGVCYCIAGNIIDRSETAGANGSGVKENQSYTLNTVDRPAVAYKVFDARGNGDGRTCPTITGDHENRITDYTAIAIERQTFNEQSFSHYKESDKCSTLKAKAGNIGNGSESLVVEKTSIAVDGYNGAVTGEKTASLTCKNDGSSSGPLVAEKTIRWIVRRFTPVECERLQGFPDNYSNIGDWTDSKGKKHKYADSPRYKALGNSIALPQWFWMVQRMRPYLKEKPTLGSLFDGLGGFPLVWQRAYGEGTARWASEIESFCVAVTKRRFGEE
jgi:DNA (cytosine-5)-methyltransferase 1